MGEVRSFSLIVGYVRNVYGSNAHRILRVVKVLGAALITNRRDEVILGDEQLSPELLDAGNGNPQVLVLLQRGPDQLLKFLIFEQLPPRQIGEGFRSRRRQTPGVPCGSL